MLKMNLTQNNKLKILKTLTLMLKSASGGNSISQGANGDTQAPIKKTRLASGFKIKYFPYHK